MKFHSIRSVFELFLQRNIDQELLVTSKKISRRLYLKKQLLPLCHIMTGIERMCLQKTILKKKDFFFLSFQTLSTHLHMIWDLWKIGRLLWCENCNNDLLQLQLLLSSLSLQILGFRILHGETLKKSLPREYKYLFSTLNLT